MKIISDPILNTIALMVEGEIPTSKKVECPVCHKQANIQAGTSLSDDTLISISAWCDNCGMGKEICGYSKWNGWEVLEPDPE